MTAEGSCPSIHGKFNCQSNGLKLIPEQVIFELWSWISIRVGNAAKDRQPCWISSPLVIRHAKLVSAPIEHCGYIIEQFFEVPLNYLWWPSLSYSARRADIGKAAKTWHYLPSKFTSLFNCYACS